MRFRWSSLSPVARRRLAIGGRIAFSAVVVAACVWFALSLDWAAVGRALARAAWPMVGLATVFILFGVWVHAVRLQLLLAPAHPLEISTVTRYLLASYAATNLLPARAGEVLRVYLFRVRESVPVATSIGVIAVERLAEVVTLLLLVLPVPLLLPSLPPEIARGIGVAAMVIFVVAVVVAAIARIGRDRVRLPARLVDFVATLKSAQRPRVLAATLALTMAGWLLEGASITAILAACGVELPLYAPVLVLLTINLAIIVPSTPAQVGAFELGAVAALRMLGVDEERAIAVALLCHAVQIVPVTALGAGGIRLALAARAAE